MKSGRAAGLVLAVVDDDLLYRDYISTVLDNRFDCRVVQTHDSFGTLKLLNDNPVDCVLLDYNLGAESGLSVGELIKTKFADPPPIVMLTGEAKERTIVKAFRGGFSDFVSKQNLNIEELVEAIRGAVDRKCIARAQREDRERLEHRSRFDGLTGLHTAGFMKERAEELAGSARRRGVACGAILIRIGALESISDTFGYVIRDRALQMFASRLQKSTREEDTCGRYGDDTFLYLIDRHADLESVANCCQRLSNDLSFEANFDKGSFTIEATLGAALLHREAVNVDQLLAPAELALAQAHASGASFATAPSLPPSSGEGSADGPVAAEGGATGEQGEAGRSERLIANRQTDRRSKLRQRVLKRGKILLPGIESVIDCMVRNVSRDGACVRVDQFYSPPDLFALLIVDSGEKRSAVVRWRLGNDVGVQFLT